jgi:putative oxidoreductase
MNWRRLLESKAPPAAVLVRVAVGVVFTSEGIQKFLYPDALGAGRFAKIGIPAPEVMGPLVGVVESVGGLLILIGLHEARTDLSMLLCSTFMLWVGAGPWALDVWLPLRKRS